MPDLLWRGQELPRPQLMGVPPDPWVPDASVEDWQAVFDLIRSNERTWEYTEDDTVRPLPAAVEVLPRPVDAEERVVLRVSPPFRPSRNPSGGYRKFNADIPRPRSVQARPLARSAYLAARATQLDECLLRLRGDTWCCGFAG